MRIGKIRITVKIEKDHLPWWPPHRNQYIRDIKALARTYDGHQRGYESRIELIRAGRVLRPDVSFVEIKEFIDKWIPGASAI